MRKIDLRDFTIIIPFCATTHDRRRNLIVCLQRLLAVGHANIILSELSPEKSNLPADYLASVTHVHAHDNDPLFNKSRAVNRAAKHVTTPYLIIHDADALIPAAQYAQAAKFVRHGSAAMALPYSNRVMYIPSESVESFTGYATDRDLANMKYRQSDDSCIFVGGVNFINRVQFRAAGMMNEYIRGWGFEDMELFMRFLKLGYAVRRTEGILYHMGHMVAEDRYSHSAISENEQHYNRTLALNTDVLAKQVQSWPWVTQ